MFMLNHRYVVQILMCCLSFYFLLCMVCLFLLRTSRSREGTVNDFLLRPLCLLHILAYLGLCFHKTFHKTDPVHMHGPFAAVVWLLDRKREYFPCPRTLWFQQCFLLPQLLLGTRQGRALTNSSCPSLLLCHSLLHSVALL